MRTSHISALRALLLGAITTLLLASCEDKVSTLAGPFYSDTVQFKTDTLSGAFMQMRSVTVPKFTVGGISHNITIYSPLMLVGRVATQYENVESWGVLQFPVLADTTFAKVVQARLLLKNQNYKYGDTTTSDHIDLQLYEYSPATGVLLDSTTTLTTSQLKPVPSGVFQGEFANVNDSVLALQIDASVIPDLKSATLALVVAPGSSMSIVRAFGTMDATDTNARPALEYTLSDSSKRIVRPTSDFHVVNENSPALPSDEFSLRGSLGQRVLDTLLLGTTIDTGFQLNRYTTINNAELVLKFDPLRSRHSSLSFDTVGPAIARLTALDDTGALLPTPTNGYYNAADTTYHFQIRGLVEYWLRNPGANFGFELRSGFIYRVFASGTAIGVEDNTLNRWTFYGQNATDPTKRPKLILSYSRLQ